jgi:hypothetical protein
MALRKGDLGPAWKGGLVKANPNQTGSCPSLKPKLSDLVVTGAASSSLTNAAGFAASDVWVMRTAAMVRRDWQRTVAPRGADACFRYMLRNQLGSGVRLISFKRAAFPRLSSMTRRYRAVFAAAGSSARVFTDLVLVGRGRTEITLLFGAPLANAAPAAAFEQRLMRAMLKRASFGAPLR